MVAGAASAIVTPVQLPAGVVSVRTNVCACAGSGVIVYGDLPPVAIAAEGAAAVSASGVTATKLL